MAYHDMVKSETRINSNQSLDRMGYNVQERQFIWKTIEESWKKKLPKDKIVHLIVSGLWEQLDQIQAVKEEVIKKIKTQSRKYSEIKMFKKVPGIGPIHRATISAILKTPERFANKKKVWMLQDWA